MALLTIRAGGSCPQADCEPGGAAIKLVADTRVLTARKKAEQTINSVRIKATQDKEHHAF